MAENHLTTCPALASHILQFFDLRRRCSKANACWAMKHAVDMALGDAGRESPQVLSVLFCQDVGWAELSALLQCFSYVTSLEITQRQIPYLDDGEDQQDDDDEDDDDDDDDVSRDCSRARIPFGEYFADYLMNCRSFWYCQKLFVHTVRGPSGDYGISGSFISTLWHSDSELEGKADLAIPLPKDIVPANIGSWRKETGVGDRQSAIRVLYHKQGQSASQDWGNAGLDVDDCGSIFPLCPALAILHFPFMAPIHRFGDDCFRHLGQHCRELRSLHLRHPGSSPISNVGLECLHLEALEVLAIGGAFITANINGILHRLVQAPALRVLHHSFNLVFDELSCPSLQARGVKVVYDNPKWFRPSTRYLP